LKVITLKFALTGIKSKHAALFFSKTKNYRSLPLIAGMEPVEEIHKFILYLRPALQSKPAFNAGNQIDLKTMFRRL